MKSVSVVILMALALSGAAVQAEDKDNYAETIGLFKNAGESASFFDHCYGYAVFPTIGKGGLGVGAAHGSGRVYQQGKYVGDTAMTQLSIGLQIGGEAYSQIIFLQDKRAFDNFTSGNFEFDASANAVAITAAASSSTGTTGTSAGASTGQSDARTVGSYHNGIAVFTIVKGGAMAAATVAGQKFSYKAR